ncbi:hypothetical protein LTR02_013250 [Friedmanniomyces endolithicus]|nr:hypothetical protein LTR75_003178 [Friedmanniomyces endolithicus]KAK0879802.1 hypothetical protein LTR87_006439 [Friedmanniomyces endolithicus]KAK0892714.1 hypothetical protein LTR02_013250 [Friedmanniomyces endolithicus]
MRPSIARTLALAASLTITAQALDGLTVPSSIAADTEFQATFQNGNSDNYRVYLAASLAGTNGPTCYLQNSTSLSSPLNLTIPASVGPPASYYSIAIADLTTSPSPSTYSYSNHFALTASNGNYTPYEQHLGGAPFWDANALPCSSYACARQCAQAGFPGDLSDQGAWEVMKGCILGCAGVEPAASVTGPALASSPSLGTGTETGTGTGTASGVGGGVGGGVDTATQTAEEVLVTLSPGVVMTAVETTTTFSGTVATEAILGSATLTLGGAAATVSGKAVSLASNGIEVGGTTTVAFSSAVRTFATTTSSSVVQAGVASGTSAAPAATSSAGAARGREVVVAGVAGVAGLAVVLF